MTYEHWLRTLNFKTNKIAGHGSISIYFQLNPNTIAHSIPLLIDWLKTKGPFFWTETGWTELNWTGAIGLQLPELKQHERN